MTEIEAIGRFIIDSGITTLKVKIGFNSDADKGIIIWQDSKKSNDTKIQESIIYTVTLYHNNYLKGLPLANSILDLLDFNGGQFIENFYFVSSVPIGGVQNMSPDGKGRYGFTMAFNLLKRNGVAQTQPCP